NTLDASAEENALPILEVLWLHQQMSVPNRDLLVKVLQSPVERARIAGQRVAWHWSERETHQVASADTTISGMQYRTYYEPWWGLEEISPEEASESGSSESTLTEKTNDGPVPPSQRVVLDNKGVGPITEVNLPESIDEEM